MTIDKYKWWIKNNSTLVLNGRSQDRFKVVNVQFEKYFFTANQGSFNR